MTQIEEEISKIKNTLEQTASNYSQSKQRLTEWAKKLGVQEELAIAQKDLWTDLSGKNISQPIVASGTAITQEALNQSNAVLSSIWQGTIDSSISTASTASESSMGVVLSGASTVYTQGAYPRSYDRIMAIARQGDVNEIIAQKLELISPSLSREYQNAWKTLYTSSYDPERGPMFLIREVITRLYHHFAPKEKVVVFYSSNSEETKIIEKKGVIRRQRIAYIASIITDPWQKSAFIQEQRAFEDIYDQLNYAHKHGALDTEKARGSLYQANALIKLILQSLM